MIPGLEEKCDVCDGTGERACGVKWCISCRGRGSVPNDEGKAFLEFLKHHLEEEYGELMAAIRSGLSGHFEYRHASEDD